MTFSSCPVLPSVDSGECLAEWPPERAENRCVHRGSVMNSFPAPTTFHSHFWSVLCLYSIFCSVWRIQPLSFSSSFLLARSIYNFGYLFRNFIFTYCMLHEFYMRREWRCWLSLWRTRWLFLFTSSRPLGLLGQATLGDQIGDLAFNLSRWESPKTFHLCKSWNQAIVTTIISFVGVYQYLGSSFVPGTGLGLSGLQGWWQPLQKVRTAVSINIFCVRKVVVGVAPMPSRQSHLVQPNIHSMVATMEDKAWIKIVTQGMIHICLACRRQWVLDSVGTEFRFAHGTSSHSIHCEVP